MDRITPHPEPPFLTCLLLALAACGPQASTDYRGEPLLSMSGRVELALDREDADQLIPALAFAIDEHDAFEVVEVEVEGEFPAGFTLDVYDPPPSAAFMPASDEIVGEPHVAVGYITAVTQDHPEVIQFTVHAGSGSLSCASGAECTGTGDRFTYMEWDEWCTADGSECYREERTCPAHDSPPDQCEHTTTGDPALKANPWDQFAGLSENYAVVYLRDAAPPRTYTAHVLGAREAGLDAGYHLIAIAPGTSARLEQVRGCQDDADTLAAERVSDEYGTAFTADQLRFDACADEVVPCEDGSFCGSFTEPCPAEAVAAFDAMRELIPVELDCPVTYPVLTPVADPERERVAVRIGMNLQPITSRQQTIEESAGTSTDVPVPADAGSGMAAP